jgi:CHAD domain-containing protein
VTEPSLDPNHAVHQSRKKIKRLRALLRLLRPHLGRVFKDENQALRETAQRLTSAREAAAAIEAVEQLEVEQRGGISPERFAAARADLTPHAPADRAGVSELLAGAAAAIQASRQRLQELELPRRGWKLVGRGFKDDYRRARQALASAAEHGSAEAFHELRKAVKTHQHELQLFEPAWPEQIEPRRRALGELAELLGHHHDLTLLAPNLRQRGFDDVAQAAVDRAAELEPLILGQARQLLSERPRHLGATLRAWYENYQSR